MQNTYFIQYYDRNPWFKVDNKPIPLYSFNNGFSQSYKAIKNYGDFIWLESGSNIPIDKGNLVISLQNSCDGLDKIIQTAKDNPQLNIVLGGPYFYVKRNLQVPDNIKVIEQTNVEEYYGLEYNPNNWGLEIPSNLYNIGYNFSLISGHGCYWGNCTYCKWANKHNDFRVLRVNEVPIIEHEGPKIISLRTSAITTGMLQLFKTFPDRDDVYYSTYLRGDREVLSTLRSIIHQIKTNNIIISMGIEIPSNEMLSFINKGTTKETILDTLRILHYNGIHLHLSFMLGWDNLTQNIVDEAEQWIRDFTHYIDPSNVSALLYRLMVNKQRPIYKQISSPVEQRPDGAYECVLSPEQETLNNYLRTIYHKTFQNNLVDFYERKDDYSSWKRKW